MTFADYFLSVKGGISPWLMLLTALGSGLAGMATHWFKKTFKSETTATFTQWFFTQNIKGSILSIGTTITGIVTAFMPLPIDSMTLWGALTTGWAIGFASDSIGNSATDNSSPL